MTEQEKERKEEKTNEKEKEEKKTNKKASEKEKEKNEVSLVKINSELYKEAAEMVEVNQIDYPSIKNFIEVAVRNQINLIKYDIDNRYEVITHNGKLKAGRKKEFTSCLLCSRLFINEKEKSKNGKRICPKCKEWIKKLNKLVD
jgi:hypothetical protein